MEIFRSHRNIQVSFAIAAMSINKLVCKTKHTHLQGKLLKRNTSRGWKNRLSQTLRFPHSYKTAFQEKLPLVAVRRLVFAVLLGHSHDCNCIKFNCVRAMWITDIERLTCLTARYWQTYCQCDTKMLCYCCLLLNTVAQQQKRAAINEVTANNIWGCFRTTHIGICSRAFDRWGLWMVSITKFQAKLINLCCDVGHSS
jgi:hypothetical protein